MSCWSCQAEVAAGALLCAACGRVQPPGPGGDPFSALGLPRAFVLPPGEPERARRERLRLVHPDRFARADPPERRHALEQAARLNEACRTLADPRRRAEALLALAGGPTPPGPGDPADPALTAFLEEQLALRERLAEAQAAGDDAAAAAIARGARARLGARQGELARLLEGSPDEEALREVARLLGRMRYDEALVAEAEVPRATRPGGA